MRDDKHDDSIENADESYTAGTRGLVSVTVPTYDRSSPVTRAACSTLTSTAVQSVAGHRGGHTTWFDTLGCTCERIGCERYDVALIGAGGCALPFGAFVKSQSKQAVHVGGATQIPFGIRGHRREADPHSSSDVGTMLNNHWVRPLPEETPSGAELGEDACHWRPR